MTPAEIEECKGIIRRWIASGRIRVVAPLPAHVLKWNLTRARRTRPLGMKHERRFSL